MAAHARWCGVCVSEFLCLYKHALHSRHLVCGRSGFDCVMTFSCFQGCMLLTACADTSTQMVLQRYTAALGKLCC